MFCIFIVMVGSSRNFNIAVYDVERLSVQLVLADCNHSKSQRTLAAFCMAITGTYTQMCFYLNGTRA